MYGDLILMDPHSGYHVNKNAYVLIQGARTVFLLMCNMYLENNNLYVNL